MQDSSSLMTRYSFENELGSGGFGTVYKAVSTESKKEFALKVDKKRKGNVREEADLLFELQGGEGIPQVFEVGETELYTYMVMTLLGASLSKYQKQQGGSIPIPELIQLLDQALTRLEYIHSKGIVHRDLKPQQFLFGPSDQIFLVDYGLARKFKQEGKHIKFQSNCSRAGNSTYASLNNHSGIHQTRRDDLESLGYMSISLIKGRLPWQQSSKLPSNIKWDRVFSIKSSLPLNELCANCPKSFMEIIKYARSLEFNQDPDYDYIRRMIHSASSSNNLVTMLPEGKKKPRRNMRENDDLAVGSREMFVLYKSGDKHK